MGLAMAPRTHNVPTREESRRIEELIAKCIQDEVTDRNCILDRLWEAGYELTKDVLYQRLSRNHPEAVRRIAAVRKPRRVPKPPEEQQALCTYPGCTRPRSWKGLCRGHHDRQAKGRPMNAGWRSENAGKTCSVPSCSSPAFCKLLCSTHYTRKVKKEPNWSRPVKARHATGWGDLNIGCIRAPQDVIKHFEEHCAGRKMTRSGLLRELLDAWHKQRLLLEDR